MEGEFNKESEKKYLSVVSLFRITKENLRTICMAANEGLSNEKLELKISEVGEIMKSYVNTDGDAEVFQNEFEKEIYEDLQ
jgi:hypothetical protein